MSLRLAHVEGVERAIAKLRLTSTTTAVKFTSNLYQAGKFLQKVSQEIVPIDTKALHDSAKTTLFSAGWYSNVAISYGNAKVQYAVRVHEDLDMNHGAKFNSVYAAEIAQGRVGYKMKRPDEQAKFLEKPARDHQATILAIIMRGLSA